MRTWFSGKRTCAPFLSGYVLNQPGEYLMYPTSANGQPAAVAYRRQDPDRPHTPFAIAVLATDARQITAITVFTDPAVFERFGYPADLPARERCARR